MMRLHARDVGALNLSALLVSAAFVACSSGGSQRDDGPVDPATGTAAAKLTGLDGCLRACETFAATGCRTRAATFCASARQNCSARYNAATACRAELEALDACSAAQPASSYVCPLGTSPDPIRPYRLSQDVCVAQALALASCLDP
jgi:hypothetical protein